MISAMPSRMRLKGRNVKTIGFFAPSFVLIAVFLIYPMILSVLYSFSNMSLTGSAAQSMKFVGFSNFTEIFKDPKLATVINNTIIFLVFSGIIGQQITGFLLAYLMKRKHLFLRQFVGFTVMIGWITPEIVAAFMFSAFFADKGTLNNIMHLFGVSPISWLFTFPMVCVVVANIWKGTAYSMMMYQASLDSISDDILEAARIDGAHLFQVIFRIILPNIRGTLGTTFVMVTLGTLGAFGLIFAMTGGGPGSATTTLSLFMYQKAFIAYQIGYGMAIALVILAIGVVLSLVYINLIKSQK